MKRVVLAAMFWTACASLAIAQAHPASLEFSLDRGGPQPVQYTLSVDESGAGSYRQQSAPGTAGSSVDTAARPIRVSEPLVKKLFAAVPMVEGGRCETHSKGIAKTGAKVLRYNSAARQAQCAFNYSDDDRVNDAAQVFESIAETLQFGDRLAAKLRFDRLGLDSELEGLQTAVDEGRALEVGNISPVLQRIEQDERVMDRVRRRAERLLAKAGTTQPAEADAGPSER